MWGLSSDTWIAIGAIATIITAAGTLAAAVAAAVAARGSQKAAEGQLIAVLVTEFEQMDKAISEITGWRDSDATSRQSMAQFLHPYRRRLAYYFQKVYLLHKNGSIADGVLRAVVSEGQAALYLATEPLEHRQNPQYDSSSFKFYARKYGLDRVREGWKP